MKQTKGQRIRALRLDAGLTQTELAKRIGIGKQTMSKYEKDIVTNIPSDRIELLAKELHTTEMYILGYEEKENDSELLIKEVMSNPALAPKLLDYAMMLKLLGEKEK